MLVNTQIFGGTTVFLGIFVINAKQSMLVV